MSSAAGGSQGIRWVIVMGVSGAGKSTVGRLLAATLGWDFFDADDFHPESNVEKMASGRPLDDEDRRPWLLRLQSLIRERPADGPGAVLACSALKAAYRDLLDIDDPRVALVHLQGSQELLARRLGAREGHFMPPDLLLSQLDTLEVPSDAVTVDIAATPEQICREIISELGLSPAADT